jgi:hypothetical protein
MRSDLINSAHLRAQATMRDPAEAPASFVVSPMTPSDVSSSTTPAK